VIFFIKQAIVRWQMLLCLALLTFSAKAQVYPPGVGVCLNGPLPPFQTGQRPANSGRWSNPDRPGLTWDFTFNSYPTANGEARTLTAYWYGFSATEGKPVWYISNTTQYDEQTGWEADLYRARQTPQGTAEIAEVVGRLAVSFVPGQPEHIAVQWQLVNGANYMPSPITECLQRVGSDGNPAARAVNQVGR
jgi:hypothetical protein